MHVDFTKITKYKSPNKGKIANYKNILKQGNVVVAVFKRINSKNETYATLGRVWENNFGGGTSETHIIPGYLGDFGVFIISKETYDNLLANHCEKIKK